MEERPLRQSEHHGLSDHQMTEEEITASVISRLGGWIQHSGGPCPVPGKKVFVVLRSGRKRNFVDASRYIWAWDEDLDPSANIMSYKVLNDR